MPRIATLMSTTPDLTFTHRDLTIALKPERYRQNDGADIPDDGIIDQVAIWRRAMGDATVRLSQRELICLVARLYADGRSDAEIGELVFGEADSKPVHYVRLANGIGFDAAPAPATALAAA